MSLRLAAAGLLLAGAAAAQPAGEPLPVFGVPALELDGLEDPSGACFDEQGVLHVAEARANRVSRFAPDGSKLGEWGADGLLSRPRGLACTGDELFVLDAGHGRLLVTDREGRVRERAGAPGHGSRELHDPRAVAVRGGLVAVADTGNDRVVLLERDAEGLRFRLRLSPFAQPRGVAWLSDGSLAVADTQADRLVRLDPVELSPQPFGARGEAPGLFSRPTGLAADGGRLYSVDTENHRVQVFEADGTRLGGWGRHAWLPHEGEGKLHYPEVVAIDAARDRAAVCEPFEDRCQLFARGEQPPDPARDRVTRRIDRSSHYGRRLHGSGRLLAMTEMDGTSVSLMDLPRELPILIHRIGRPGEGHGLFRDVVAAIVDGPSGVLTADAGARRIAWWEHDHDPEAETRFDPRLSRLVRELDFTELELKPPARPVALARGAGAELFVLDAAGSRVVVLDPAGTLRRWFGGFGAEPGLFRFPTELAFEPASGRLFVVDSGNRRVQVFDSDGSLRGLLGGPELFVEPFGLALGPTGRVFVADRGANRVIRLDANGTPDLQWGDAEPDRPPQERMGPGQLHRPTGLAFMEDGRLLVLDHGHHRGQIFTADGEYLAAFGARLYTRPTRGVEPFPPERLHAD